MSPIYAVLSAPLARPLGVPVLLWFTHWRRSRLLELAERLSTKVLSVDRTSFPLDSTKLVAVGHGIDVDSFVPAARADDGSPARAGAGPHVTREGPRDDRRGCGAARRDARVARGTRPVADARGSRGAPFARAARRGPRAHRACCDRGTGSAWGGHAGLRGRRRARQQHARRCARQGRVRSAAAALPTLVASAGFDPLVAGIEPSLRFAQDDPESLAAGLRALAAAGPERRRAVGLELRERVRREHSTDHWADAVLAAIP